MKHNTSREKLLDAAFSEVYQYGYHGAATASILKSAGVPKGSMYHHFDSKKALVLAATKERIFPKMDQLFKFTAKEDENTLDVMQRIFTTIANNENLIRHGCPLYRLMVEMAPLDKDFDTLLSSRYQIFVQDLKALLDAGINKGEFLSFDTQSFSEFAITSSWGQLSLSPSHSSKEQFLTHTKQILKLLTTYKA